MHSMYVTNAAVYAAKEHSLSPLLHGEYSPEKEIQRVLNSPKLNQVTLDGLLKSDVSVLKDQSTEL